MRGGICFTWLLVVFAISPPEVAVAVAVSADIVKVFDAKNVRGSFLSRGVGARAVGMGEAFVAVADDSTAAAWNPGGLGRLRSVDLVAVHDIVGEGISQSFFSGALPVGRGAFGLLASVLNYGNYDVRDASGVKTGSNSLVDMVVSGSYGYQVGVAALGIGVEYVNEGIGGSIVGFNAGGIVQVARSLTFGAAVRHLGGTQDGFSLPTSIHGGAAYVIDSTFRLATDAGYGLTDKLLSFNTGIEMFLQSMFVLRGGYKFSPDNRGIDDLIAFTAGFGFRYNVFGIDYAYQPLGQLAQSHRIGFTYRGAVDPEKI